MRAPRLALAAALLLTPAQLARAAASGAASPANVPVFFVANAGQTRPDVRFQAAIGGRVVWFTDREIFWTTSGAAAEGVGIPSPARARKLSAQASSQGKVSIGSIAFDGVRLSQAAIEELQPLRARVNFFRGPDPGRWRTRVPAYAALVYRGLYPGIDLRFESRSGRIHSTFTVAPGADPSRISWRSRVAARVLRRRPRRPGSGAASATLPSPSLFAASSDPMEASDTPSLSGTIRRASSRSTRAFSMRRTSEVPETTSPTTSPRTRTVSPTSPGTLSRRTFPRSTRSTPSAARTAPATSASRMSSSPRSIPRRPEATRSSTRRTSAEAPTTWAFASPWMRPAAPTSAGSHAPTSRQRGMRTREPSRLASAPTAS